MDDFFGNVNANIVTITLTVNINLAFSLPLPLPIHHITSLPHNAGIYFCITVLMYKNCLMNNIQEKSLDIKKPFS